MAESDGSNLALVPLMEVSDIIQLSTAVVLTIWLCSRFWRRARAPVPETHWTGHGIDVTAVSGRVERLRGDFAAELRGRPDRNYQRRGLLASARRAVGQLAFFRVRHPESPACTEAETEIHTG